MNISEALPAANPFELPKPLTKAQQLMEFGQSAIFAIDSMAPIIRGITGKFPRPVAIALKATNFFHGAVGLLSIPTFASDIYNAIKSSTVVDRVKNICKAVISGGSVILGGNSILGGLKTVGVIAKNSLPWTSIVAKFLFPLEVLSAGLAAHDVSEIHDDRREILDNMKVEDLTKACQYVIKNKERLRKVFVVSKKTQIDLRAERIMKGLQSENLDAQRLARQEGEEFVNTLRRRINTKYGLQVAALAVKVTGVVSLGVSLFVPPNPVTLGIGAICAVAGFALYGLEKLLINKDPFTKSSDVWHEQIFHQARTIVYKGMDAVEGAVLLPRAS